MVSIRQAQSPPTVYRWSGERPAQLWMARGRDAGLASLTVLPVGLKEDTLRALGETGFAFQPLPGAFFTPALACRISFFPLATAPYFGEEGAAFPCPLIGLDDSFDFEVFNEALVLPWGCVEDAALAILPLAFSLPPDVGRFPFNGIRETSLNFYFEQDANVT